MFEHILVPLDGSRLSEAALEPAAYIAEKLNSQVTLLHVIEQDAPSEVHKELHLTRPDEAQAYLIETAKRAFPTKVGVRTHVHSAPVSDVAHSIVEHATDEFQPDLIVMCTHGHSGLRDMLFGSIAQQIVAQRTAPLLLVKPGGIPFKLDTLLVPLDPDSIHDASLGISKSFAQVFNAELLFLSVIPTFLNLTGEQAAAGSLMPVTATAYLNMKDQHAREDLQMHLDEFQLVGLKASAEVLRGDPASLIVKAAGKPGVDMLILSTHRKAGTEAFWARSVAPIVLQKITKPLLLIPISQIGS